MSKNDKLINLMLGKSIKKGWQGGLLKIVIFGLLITGIVTLSVKLFSEDCPQENNNKNNKESCSYAWNNLDKNSQILYGSLLVINLALFFIFIFYTEGLFGIFNLFSK